MYETFTFGELETVQHQTLRRHWGSRFMKVQVLIFVVIDLSTKRKMDVPCIFICSVFSGRGPPSYEQKDFSFTNNCLSLSHTADWHSTSRRQIHQNILCQQNTNYYKHSLIGCWWKYTTKSIVTSYPGHTRPSAAHKTLDTKKQSLYTCDQPSLLTTWRQNLLCHAVSLCQVYISINLEISEAASSSFPCSRSSEQLSSVSSCSGTAKVKSSFCSFNSLYMLVSNRYTILYTINSDLL